MTIYFHIGSPKTGTTSLQQFLAANRSRLADQGYQFPSFLGEQNHTKLAAYAVNEGRMLPILIDLRLTDKEKLAVFRPRLEEIFTKKINSDANYIFSNEHCLGFLSAKEEKERLKGLVTRTGQDVQIIIYFREPVAYHASRFSTNVKMGRTRTIARPSDSQMDEWYDYYSIAMEWAHVFGKDNVTVRIFSRDVMKQGDIRQDFCEVLGLDDSLLDFHYATDPTANRSLDYLIASFMLEFNALVPRYIDNRVNPFRGDLAHLSEVISTREGILVPERVATFMTEKLEASMARLNKEFLGGEETSPFAPYNGEGKSALRKLRRKEFLEVYAQLWSAKIAKEKGLKL